MTFRYGGEEFVILLSETHLDEATEIAEIIRIAVEIIPWLTICRPLI